MSSGEQTCQHPPRECPCPPSALTPQTICSGLRDRASGQHIFCTDTHVAFVSHDCLWLAYCYPQYVIAGKVYSMSWGKEEQNNAEFGSLLKCLTVVRFCSEGTVFVEKPWLCYIQPWGDMCQRGIPVISSSQCVSLHSKWLLLKQTLKHFKLLY